jgi:hypothetical protein
MPRMRRTGRPSIAAPFTLVALLTSGCAAAVSRLPQALPADDFFPLTPSSHWEYVVNRRPDGFPLRFSASVQSNEFLGPNGHACRVVDEHYGDRPPEERTPIVYCSEAGFLHRVLSLEYRGESLQDNGLRSGEVNFFPVNLTSTQAWEGRTNAYQLPDGSGFEVRQLHQVAMQREPIDVPAGRFEHCARIETTAIHSATSPDGSAVGPRIVYYYSDWYAPGVGLVRTEQRNAATEVVATIELVSFHVTPQTRLR